MECLAHSFFNKCLWSVSQVLAEDTAVKGTDPSPCLPGTSILVDAQMPDGIWHIQAQCCLPSPPLGVLTHPYNKGSQA